MHSSRRDRSSDTGIRESENSPSPPPVGHQGASLGQRKLEPPHGYHYVSTLDQQFGNPFDGEDDPIPIPRIMHSGQAPRSTRPGSESQKLVAPVPRSKERFANPMSKMVHLLHMLQSGSNDNVFVSPFNLEHALLMFSHAVTNPMVKQAFQQSLGFNPEQVHRVFGEKMNLLSKCNNQNESLLPAASIWIARRNLGVARTTGAGGGAAAAAAQRNVASSAAVPADIQQFSNFVSEFYQAEVFPFIDVQAINGWVDQKTQHMIPKIIDNLDSDRTELVIVSALYFYAPWRHPFKQSLTSPEPFTTSSGQVRHVPMMRHGKSKDFLHYSNVDLQAQSIILPYGKKMDGIHEAFPESGGQGSCEAWVILPDHPITDSRQWEPILQAISSNSAHFRSRHQSRDVKVFLPKFRVEYGASVLPSLSQLEPPDANIYRQNVLRPGWSISNIFHKVVVDVDEEGTEAAAATVMTTYNCITAAPVPPIEFRVNRPFVFVVYSPRTEDILFIGIVNDVPLK